MVAVGRKGLDDDSQANCALLFGHSRLGMDMRSCPRDSSG